jgi:thioredoxin domain-containing protein 5
MEYNLKKPSLILFHANWCGHCKRFMPTWDEFKTKINREEYNVIEIEDGNSFTKKINKLNGYPTVFFIHNDIVIEYKDNRTVKSLLHFLEKNKKLN